MRADLAHHRAYQLVHDGANAAIKGYDAGNYAYWLASGISTDYDQAMVENCIELFCTENLSE